MPTIDPKTRVRNARRVFGSWRRLLPVPTTNPEPGSGAFGAIRPHCALTICDRPWNVTVHGSRTCQRCPWSTHTDR